MKEQFDIVVKQKKEISDLYRKVADAKEELRQQNEVLQNLNMKIRQNEEELKYLAYHDLLTELPNRKLVYESLENIIKETKDPGIIVYVVFIDIDYFKNINDTLGHHVGDIFINEAAKRLRNSFVQEDILGRTGGDEFTLIINRNLTKDEVYSYLETVRDKFAESFVIHNTIIQSTASFGVSIYPRDGEDVISLMKKSDVAMYKAKEQGKNKILFYEQDIPCDII
jgi:diguanylate cyclase (GGDEF)-like protein